MEYGLAAFNSAGVRDDRELGAPPTAEVRVAMIGDSLVWSEYMALEDSLPRSVERALGKERAEVLNFGVSGYDTAQEVLWYRKAARPLGPQVVVLVYCMNDMIIMSGPYNRYATPEEARRKEEQDQMFEDRAPVRRETLDRVARRDEDQAWLKLFARARALWRRATFDSHYIDEYTIAAAEEARVETTTDAIARFGEAVAEDGARGVLVISPVLESWDHYHWAHIHELVAKAGEAANLEVLDPLERWRGELDPKKLRFPGDNLHYNPRGNQVLGQAIAEAIGEL